LMHNMPARPHPPSQGSLGHPLIPQLCRPEGDRATPFTLLSSDELIARLLIDTWTLTTGKTLRCDVPPQELTEEELIDFWSDDHLDPAVGHRYWLAHNRHGE